MAVLLIDVGSSNKGIGVYVVGHSHAVKQEGTHGFQARTANLTGKPLTHQDGVGQVGGHFDEATGDGNRSAHDHVGAPTGEPKGAGHGGAGFNADAQAERLQACGCRVGQHVLHCNLQVDGGLQGLLGMGGFGYTGAAVL